MGAHIVNGKFQSDKYPGCPAGKVPLSVEDPTAQDLLWQYAQRHRKVDAEFSADLELALQQAGFPEIATPRHWPEGKFTGSTHEENWNGSSEETFDTRAEALGYANELAADLGVEDGSQCVFTGVVRSLTADELAAYAGGADSVVDDIDEFICENFDEEVCGGINSTTEQRDDLRAMLHGTIAAWLVKHDLVPNVCHIEKVQSEVWHQCGTVNERNGGPSSTDRCARHDGHSGEHEFEGP